MKRIIFLLLVLSLIVVACSKQVPTQEPIVPEVEEPVQENETVKEEVVLEVEEKVVAPTMCTHHSNCTGTDKCLDGTCQAILKETKEGCNCRIAKVAITTSDGEKYNIAPGQGSYVAGSALSWKIINPGTFCKGKVPAIPFEIVRRNYKNVLGEQYISVKKGATSQILDHPVVTSIKLQLTVTDVTERCS